MAQCRGTAWLGLWASAGTNLKEDVFGQFTAIYSPQDEIRVFNFALDQEWVTQVREDLGRRRRT
jgi:hypothetical protein